MSAAKIAPAPEGEDGSAQVPTEVLVPATSAAPAAAKSPRAAFDVPAGGASNNEKTSRVAADGPAVPQLTRTASQEKAIQRATQTDKRTQVCRPIVRCVSFAVILLALWGLGTVFMLQLAIISETHTYHTGEGLTLEVSGCDVDFVPGAAPTITYSAITPAYTSPQTFAAGSDPEAVNYLVARNGGSHPCDAFPHRYCRHACFVTVAVPPEAAGTTFLLMQSPSDPNAPLVHVKAGTRMGALNSYKAGGYKLADMPVLVENATVSSIDLWAVHGSLYVVRSTVGAVKYRSYYGGSGAAYLLGMPVGTDDVDLAYRQPSNRLCLASTEPEAAAQFSLANPENPWASCDVTALRSGDTTNIDTWSISLLRWLYDADSNSQVTMTEFIDGLQKLTCCGSNCPFDSWCEDYAYQVGFGLGFGNSELGTSGNALSVGDFATNLLDTNKSQWMPRCTTGMQLRHTASLSERATRSLGSGLTSDGGEVVVALSADTTQALPAPGDGHAAFTPAEKMSGFRLNRVDAKRLSESYGKDYADRDATGDVIIVIDVHLGGSHDAHSRWLYATRAAYLAVDPGVLALLSLGLLLPPIRREKVTFFDDDCTLAGPRIAYDHAALGSEELATLYARVQEHLLFALKSSSVDYGAPRPGSAFVRIGVPADHEGPVLYASAFRYMEYPTIFAAGVEPGSEADAAAPAPPQSIEREWYDQRVHFNMRFALVLSIIIGVGIATALLVAVTRHLSQMLVAEYESKLAATIVVLKKQNARDAAGAAKRIVSEPSANPWVEGALLLELMLVRPLRKKLLDPLTMFVNRRLKTDDRKSGRFIYLGTFAQRYELFCLGQDLTPIRSRVEIQQRLIEKYDVRCKVVGTRRIRNLRFRTPADAHRAHINLALDPNSTVEVNERAEDLPKQLPPRGTVTNKARSEAVSRIVACFVAERCLVTSSLNFIDVETRTGPDGLPKMGLKEALTAWCAEHGLEAPKLKGNAWRTVLPYGASLDEEYNARQIKGLAWLQDTDVDEFHERITQHVSNSWLLLEVLTVLVHCLAIFSTPLFLIIYALDVQSTWALDFAPLDLVDGAHPHSWSDYTRSNYGVLFLFTSTMDGKSYLHPATEMLIWEGRFFALIGLLFYAIHYVSPGKTAKISWQNFKKYPFNILFGQFCAACLASHVFMFFSLLGSTFCWALLAAALDPTRYLPVGAGVLAVVLTASIMWRQMTTAAEAFRAKMAKAYDEFMQVKMRRAMREISEKVRATRDAEAAASGEGSIVDARSNWAIVDAPDGDEGNEGEAAPLTAAEEAATEQEAVVSASDIFAALNVDGDDELSRTEFEAVFKLLDLNLSRSQRDQLFAYCDLNGSDTINEAEFVKGWEKIVKAFSDEVVANVGLSQLQIFIIILFNLTILVLLMVFILVTLAAWSSESTFTSLVQSSLVGGLGRVVTGARRKGKAEQGDMQSLVDEKIEEYASIVRDERNTEE